MSSTNTFAPGNVVVVRDEDWLVTSVDESSDGPVLNAQGLSDLVRGQDAVFYPSLDQIKLNDPRDTTVRPDDSPKYRRSRLWVESTLRKTAVPLSDDSLTVSPRMLARQLGYQHKAVAKALDPATLRPRTPARRRRRPRQDTRNRHDPFRAHPPRPRGADSGGHPATRVGADAARDVEPLRHPVRAPRLPGCCPRQAEVARQPQTVFPDFRRAIYLHRKAEAGVSPTAGNLEPRSRGRSPDLSESGTRWRTPGPDPPP